MVNRLIICLEKKKKSMGIRNLSILKKALCYKWCWKFAKERNPLRKPVIVGKYELEDGDWYTKEVRRRNGVWV